MVQNSMNGRPLQAARPRKPDAWRLWAVLAVFTLFGLYNVRTLFSVQVLQHSDLTSKAEAHIQWTDTLAPVRGLIYDSQGQLLAGNTTAEDLYVDKSNLLMKDGKTYDDGQLHQIADLLAPALNQQPDDLFQRL